MYVAQYFIITVCLLARSNVVIFKPHSGFYLWGGGGGGPGYGSPLSRKVPPKIKLCRLNFCEGVQGHVQLQQTDLWTVFRNNLSGVKQPYLSPSEA